MNYFDKRRLVIWAFVSLTVMNVASLATVWWQRQGPRGPRPPAEAGRRFLFDELQLDDQQTEAFRQAQDRHFAATRKIDDRIRRLRADLFAELGKAQPNDETANQIAGEIGREQTELERLTFSHFQELREICTPEQRERLARILAEALPRGGPRGGPPPPGGPGERRPPPPPPRHG